MQETQPPPNSPRPGMVIRFSISYDPHIINGLREGMYVAYVVSRKGSSLIVDVEGERKQVPERRMNCIEVLSTEESIRYIQNGRMQARK